VPRLAEIMSHTMQLASVPFPCGPATSFIGHAAATSPGHSSSMHPDAIRCQRSVFPSIAALRNQTSPVLNPLKPQTGGLLIVLQTVRV
jgi:hypothetical protein